MSKTRREYIKPAVLRLEIGVDQAVMTCSNCKTTGGSGPSTGICESTISGQSCCTTGS